MIRLKFVCIQYWDGDSVPCVKRSISSQSFIIRSTISAAHWSRSWTRRQWQNEAMPIMISLSFRIMPTHSTMRRTPLPMLFDKAVKLKNLGYFVPVFFMFNSVSTNVKTLIFTLRGLLPIRRMIQSRKSVKIREEWEKKDTQITSPMGKIENK